MTDDDIAWLDLSTVARLIRQQVLSAEQVTQVQLRRIERLDPVLHAYARSTPELALTQARAADQRQAQGQVLGPLHGVPIAVKDLCWTAGIPTAAGMPMYQNFVPDEDATRIAYKELILWMEAEYGYDRWDAYMMLSQCGQVRLGNFVDPKYTVGAGISKKYLAAA